MIRSISWRATRCAARASNLRLPLAQCLSPRAWGYCEVMRNSVLSAPAVEGEKSDCLMLLSEFLLEFFDRISGIITDAYTAEGKP